MDRRRRTSPNCRAHERGVVLILTLFVILITYALVTQLQMGTAVAYQTTRNAADRVRLQAACRSAAQQVFDNLRDDLGTGDEGGAGAAADAMSGAFGDQAPVGGEDGAAPEEDDGSNSDSWEDPWARPMQIAMGNVEITAWVQDENSKFNLLTLAHPDEEQRQIARDRCARILDRLRDGYNEDLSLVESRRLADRIAEWIEGGTRSEEYPRPPRHSDLEDSEVSLPYALEELLLLEDVPPVLFHDRLDDDDVIAPGLETVFTVWTTIELEAPENDTAVQDEAAASDAGRQDPSADAGGGGDPFGDDEAPLGDAASGGFSGLSGALEGDPAIGTLLNLNTMPRAVLEGLLDSSEFPPSVVDEILEYRNRIDEEALLALDEREPEARELEAALYGEEEHEPRLYFKSLDDLDDLEAFQTRVPQEARQAFLDLVGVQSDVFSIYLVARIKPDGWIPETRYEEPPGPVLRMRSIVWRRNAGGEGKIITLIPWHEVPYTRWLIPDFQDRLPMFQAPAR